MVQNILLKVNHKIVQYFNQFLVTFKLLPKLIKIFHGDLKDCQKKVLKLRLHQIMTVFHLQKIRVKIKENYLIQGTITFLNVNVVNYYFIYEIDTQSRNLNSNFALIVGGRGDGLGGIKLVQIGANTKQKQEAIRNKVKEADVQNFKTQLEILIKVILYNYIISSSIIPVSQLKLYLCL